MTKQLHSPTFDTLPDQGFLDRRELIEVAKVGIKKSEIHARVAEGRFPAPVHLGTRCSRWRVGDIRSWLADPAKWQAKNNSLES